MIAVAERLAKAWAISTHTNLFSPLMFLSFLDMLGYFCSHLFLWFVFDDPLGRVSLRYLLGLMHYLSSPKRFPRDYALLSSIPECVSSLVPCWCLLQAICRAPGPRYITFCGINPAKPSWVRNTPIGKSTGLRFLSRIMLTSWRTHLSDQLLTKQWLSSPQTESTSHLLHSML